MESYGLNYFNSFSQKKVIGNITAEDWLKKIQTGDHPDISNITEARQSGKHTLVYDEKKSNLPCVTWNFLFSDRMENKYIVCGTGYLYIDLDNGYKPDISTLPAEKIYAYYDSLSQTGKGLIVKISDLPKEKKAFDLVYKYVIADLGLTTYCKFSQKRVQCNVLPFDPNLYYNPNSLIYNAKEIIDISEKVANQGRCTIVNNQPLKLESQKAVSGLEDEWKFRNNNIDEYCPDEEILVHQEGIDILQLFLPKTIQTGKRKHTLLSYCTNLVLLNPNKSRETIYKALDNCNVVHCQRPLDQKEIRDIVDSIFKYKEAGTLKPQYLKKRKILFGKNTGFTAREKLSISAKQVAEWKRNKTKEKIYSFLEEYNGKEKITAKLVASNVNLSIRTLERYWSEFKEYVKTINEKPAIRY